MFELHNVVPASREALVFAGRSAGVRSVSYGELQALVDRRKLDLGTPDQRFRPLTTSLELPFFVELLAHFELGWPMLLLDPRLPLPDRAELAAEVATHRPHPGDRVVLTTSGSTGRPKLVVHTEASLLAAARASAENLGWLEQGDRWYLSLPLAHVGGLALAIRCLVGGQTIVIGEARSSQPSEVLKELGAQRVTLASFVPTQLRRLMAVWPKAGLPELRAVLVGGAPIMPGLLEEAEQLGVRLLVTYGLTEMSSQVATQRYADESPRAFTEGLVGPPLRGVDVRVGQSGRLEVRGPMAMRGYLNHRNPFDSDGFLVTSDLGRIDARGNVVVLGRADNVIITGGENVAAEAVESTILSLPGVREACIVGVPDRDWGARVALAIVLADDGTLNESRLRSTLSECLPNFARPKQVLLLPQLPQLTTGKVDRSAVRALFAEEPKASPGRS